MILELLFSRAVDSPRQQEHGRHAESHQDAHGQENREAAGNAANCDHGWDEELQEKTRGF